MRRVIGLILAGFGTFLIAIAVLLPTWISSHVIKFPLNEYQSATLEATNASYFSATALTEKTGVTMQATYTIKGDGTAGNASTAVWNQYSYVYDVTNHQAVQQMTRRFAFDRKTAVLVNCCGANVNGNSTVQQRGYLGYVFPIGTKKQTYDVFDTTLNKPVPFTYAGTSSVRGIQSYMFVENVAPVQVGTQVVPGSLVGKSAATVTMPEFDEIHLTYYVDPDTGALINVNEHQTLSLRDPATGAQALLLFDADLVATPASVTTIVGLDNKGRNELSLLTTILPLALGIAGVVALIVGILLARRPHADSELGNTSPRSAADAPQAPEAPGAPEGLKAPAAPVAASPAGGAPWERKSASADLVPGLDRERSTAERSTADSNTAERSTAESSTAEAAKRPAE